MSKTYKNIMNSKDSVQVFLKIKPDSAKSIPYLQIIDNSLLSVDNKLFKFDFVASESISLQEFF